MELGEGKEEILGSRERRHEVKEDGKVVIYMKTVLENHSQAYDPGHDQN